MPSVFLLFLILRFTFIYFGWRGQRTEILDKLASYKQQLDFMRNPLPAEERSGGAVVGAVAIPSRIYDRNSRLIGEFFAERRSLIPLEKLPEHVKNALIASEDRQFYEHRGVDYPAIVRAFLVNIFSRRISQGGSTLTQQLAKVLFTDQSRTLSRKIFEYFCVREIEHRYTKEQILEMYLNLVYFGHGNYGIEAASQFFYGRTAARLEPAETALLIGILPNPKFYSPIDGLSAALKRQKLVLDAMVALAGISRADADRNLSRFARTWKIETRNGKTVSGIGDFPDRAYSLNLAPFFLDHIRQKLLRKFSPEVITRGGLQIYTTLDLSKQQEAQKSMQIGLNRQRQYYDEKLRRKKISAAEIAQWEQARAETNGAMVTIEPKTGYTLVMIGGAEFSSQNQFNRATSAKRQVGSLIKPFVYLSAMDQKLITPASIVADEPLTIGKKTFRNYDSRFLGKITVRTALARSRNIPAVSVLKQAGLDDFRQMLADLLDIPYGTLAGRVPSDLSIALGSFSLTPMEMATMYAVMVNQGKRVIVRDLLRVEDQKGSILWEEDEIPAEASILDPVASYMTLSMLISTFEADGTAAWVSDLRRKNNSWLPYEIAGKTGTTTDFRDAWFAGLTSDEVSVIWMGNDSSISLGQGRSGSGIASPIWINFIRATRQSHPPQPFREGWELSDTVEESYCHDSGGVPRGPGLCPHVSEKQIFYQGTEPRFFCPLHLPASENLLQEPP